MGLQGFEGCDIPCEPGWQLQAADADCAEEDGGPIRQCMGVGSFGQVVQLEHLPCQVLAQGNSQDSAALPAPAPSAALFPRVLTSSLPPAQGGEGLVEVPTQIQALQANVVSRLLEPEGQGSIAVAVVLC